MAPDNRPAGKRPAQGAGRAATPSAGKAGTAAGPRRLGNQSAPPPRPGAQRRAQRAKQAGRSKLYSGAAIGVVVVALVVILVVKLTGGSNNNASTTSGGTTISASGANPPLAASSLTATLASISASAFNSVGTDGQTSAFVVTKSQPKLLAAGKPQMVYEGGEFCPYCALGRWSMIAALDRFGTFTNLHLMSSATTDGDIPTFTFIGSTYTSKYVVFSPWETSDRQRNALQSAPSYAIKLYEKYDGSLDGTQAAPPFSTGAGIPFIDLGNKYVTSGDPGWVGSIFSNGTLNNGGPGWTAIAQALAQPNSAAAKAIDAPALDAFANYITAGICSLDGGQPTSVCASSGVQAAAKGLAAVKPVG